MMVLQSVVAVDGWTLCSVQEELRCSCETVPAVVAGLQCLAVSPRASSQLPVSCEGNAVDAAAVLALNSQSVPGCKTKAMLLSGWCALASWLLVR